MKTNKEIAKRLRNLIDGTSNGIVLSAKIQEIADELDPPKPPSITKNERLQKALEVLKELQECSDYWSVYDVPIGIHERIEGAVEDVEELIES